MATSPRASARGFPGLPPLHDYKNLEDALRALWSVARLLLRGKTNNTGDVTLTVSAATTVVTDERAGNESFIHFMPLDANAAGELGFYVSSQGKQTFTITHAVDSRTRKFRYVVIG